ncbi:galactose oxidase early set domain-containing protein [Sphaerisporangium sp. B11E5]|uniref:galactose oxidase early set domain-containing protein n=1 Tax=Sphaerisporangium sp. B11E5 TaxID=3153563 RepID=UPI00325ED6D9
MAVATVVAGSVLVSASPATAALDATGQWGALLPWPVVPINSALTADGKLMTFGTDSGGVQGGQWNFDVWDPATNTHVTPPNTTFTDLFCSAQVYDPIRDVVFTVGGDDRRDVEVSGPSGVTSYSAAAGILDEAPMNMARWYPTATVMPSGEIVAEGGSLLGPDGPGVPTPEKYVPGSGWYALDGATSAYAYGDDQNRWWYPRSWVAPNGKIFGITGSNMYYLDPRGSGTVTAAGTFPGGNIGATSTAVMYRPGKILQVGGGAYSNGGGGAGSTAATTVDVNGATPVVTSVAPLTYGRHWGTSTVLPTGDVLVSGGSSANNEEVGVAREPELWHPETGTWTVLPAETQMRLYHSTATLLPDGRVLVGGGGAPGPVTNLDAQIYSPPYLFDGNAPAARPVISSAPTTLSYGSTFSLTTSGLPASGARATLVRAGAVTHSFNSGQRFIELPMTGTGASRSVTAPASATVAPPGLYLLFVVDATGTPSVAKLVNINPPGGSGAPAKVFEPFEDGAVAPPSGSIAYTTGGTFGPWTVTNGVSRDQAAAHGGLGGTGHHIDLEDNGQVRRTVTGLTPGTTYTLTLRYARAKAITSGGVSANLAIANLNNTWSAFNPSSGVFAPYSQSFTATATSHTLTVRGVSSPSATDGMIVDDLTIVPTGVPALAPLLVDGMEAGDMAAYGDHVGYEPGDTFGPWSVSSAVSRDHAAHHTGFGYVGHHLDLDDDGQVQRTVSGLVPGATYRLSLRHARHLAVTGPVSANVSIAGLNHTWSASDPSNGPFQTLVQTFTATASSHTLTLRGVSSTDGCCGMVVDDLVIWRGATAYSGQSALTRSGTTRSAPPAHHHH